MSSEGALETAICSYSFVRSLTFRGTLSAVFASCSARAATAATEVELAIASIARPAVGHAFVRGAVSYRPVVVACSRLTQLRLWLWTRLASCLLLGDGASISSEQSSFKPFRCSFGIRCPP